MVPYYHRELAERLIALVLKTRGLHGSVDSNPTVATNTGIAQRLEQAPYKGEILVQVQISVP